jgi:hypothetical protein
MGFIVNDNGSVTGQSIEQTGLTGVGDADQNKAWN